MFFLPSFTSFQKSNKNFVQFQYFAGNKTEGEPEHVRLGGRRRAAVVQRVLARTAHLLRHEGVRH